VNPTCLYNDKDSTHHSPIIGYAFDGFPIYGAYGFANADGTGGIKRMRTGFKLRNITDRTTRPDGSSLTASQYGPAIGGQYVLGYYVEDYAFDPANGDLDINNGRFCVTPDYPNGTYAYFVTVDANLNPVYPYTLGLSYYGTVQSGNTGPQSGHNTPSETVTTYDPATSSIEETGTSISTEVQFYPNPVSDYIGISLSGDKGSYLKEVKISGLDGKLLGTFHTASTGADMRIPFSEYPQGIYMLSITTSTGNVYVQKVLK
jgi:hypothetical protein